MLNPIRPILSRTKEWQFAVVKVLNEVGILGRSIIADMLHMIHMLTEMGREEGAGKGLPS